MIKKSLLLTVISLAIIFTGLSINKVLALGESELSGALEQYSETINIERLERLQKEKEQFINRTDKNNVEISESNISEDNDLDELLEQAELAYQEGQLLCDIFGQGIKIVNKYSNTKYSETVTDLRTIDRNTLEAMVSVAEQYKLTDEEKSVIKTCLAEKYYVVTKSDPLRVRINAILGIN